MMIRINLLPVRQVQKREYGKQVLILYAAVVLLGVVGNYVWYDLRDSEARRQQALIADTQARINELEKVIGEVNNIKIRDQEVKARLEVLEKLRKGRSGPVRMMDALATTIPKKVWLKEFTEEASNVRVSGTAISHEDVAELMRSLSNIVWTPKGLGRMVEQRRDATASRVELLAAEGAIEEFPVPQVANFFTDILLVKAETKEEAQGSARFKQVEFELTLKTRYDI